MLMTLSFGKKSCPTLLLLRCEFFHNLTIIPRLNACKFSDFFFIQTVHPSLLNKIAEMEEAFDKPVKGRPTKGKDTGENDAKGLSRLVDYVQCHKLFFTYILPSKTQHCAIITSSHLSKVNCTNKLPVSVCLYPQHAHL